MLDEAPRARGDAARAAARGLLMHAAEVPMRVALAASCSSLLCLVGCGAGLDDVPEPAFDGARGDDGTEEDPHAALPPQRGVEGDLALLPPFDLDAARAIVAAHDEGALSKVNDAPVRTRVPAGYDVDVWVSHLAVSRYRVIAPTYPSPSTAQIAPFSIGTVIVRERVETGELVAMAKLAHEEDFDRGWWFGRRSPGAEVVDAPLGYCMSCHARTRSTDLVVGIDPEPVDVVAP